MGEECSARRRENSHAARVRAVGDAVIVADFTDLPDLTFEERRAVRCPTCRARAGRQCRRSPESHFRRETEALTLRIDLICAARRVASCKECGASSGARCRDRDESHKRRWSDSAVAIQFSL